MRKIRWGVLGTAKIALEKVIPAMQNGQYCDVVAIASRNKEKAQTAAKQLGIPKPYGSYTKLISDPAIDAVYIPLPNHLHVPWAIKSLEANKHVLCEKPLALSATQAQKLLKAVRSHSELKITEAFMYRYHPQWLQVYQLVNTGKIGHLFNIQSFFSYMKCDSENIRNQAELGGGGLMDIGCYCISLARFLFDREPQRALGVLKYDRKFRIDRLTSGILDFDTALASFTCSTQLTPYQHANIFGTHGRIEIEIPFNAPNDKPCRIWYESGNKTKELVFNICDQYALQADQFSLNILNDTPVLYNLVDSVANMKVIDALVTSAKNGRWSSCS